MLQFKNKEEQIWLCIGPFFFGLKNRPDKIRLKTVLTKKAKKCYYQPKVGFRCCKLKDQKLNFKIKDSTPPTNHYTSKI